MRNPAAWRDLAERKIAAKQQDYPLLVSIASVVAFVVVTYSS